MSIKISSFISNIFYSMFGPYNGVFIRSLSNILDTDTTSLTAMLKIQNFEKCMNWKTWVYDFPFFSEQCFGCGVELIPTGINFTSFL